MTEQERLNFINKIDNSFTEEEKEYYLRDYRGLFLEPFNIGINGWIKNVDERIEKYPESKNTLLFEKYVLYKLYNYAERLRVESDKLFA